MSPASVAQELPLRIPEKRVPWRDPRVARSERKSSTSVSPSESRRTSPLSKEEYIRQTLASCRNNRCCQDPSLLDQAYAEYLNDPRAPWNKTRRR